MKNTRFLLCICMLSLAFSCKRPNDISNPTSVFSTYTSMDAVYNILRVQSKYVTVNSATGGSFFGNSGTRYVFPANCFMDASGVSITGNVQIEVAEYLKKGDMVFSKILPVSDGQDLVSAGEIYVNGMAGGVKVYIKPGMSFTAFVPQPGTAVLDMSYFSGIASSDTSLSVVNWRRFDSATSRIFYVKDTFKTKKDTLAFVCDSMKWINGDQYRSGANNQKFNVNLSPIGGTIGSTSDIRSHIFVDSLNSLTSLGYNPHTNSYKDINFDKMAVHFVVYGLIDKKFYGGILAATPTTGSTYNITLSEVKPEDFKAQVNNLTQ